MNPRKLAKNLSEKDDRKSIVRQLVDREVENRCAYCDHLLFVGILGEGTCIETKCPRCRQLPVYARGYQE